MGFTSGSIVHFLMHTHRSKYCMAGKKDEINANDEFQEANKQY